MTDHRDAIERARAKGLGRVLPPSKTKPGRGRPIPQALQAKKPKRRKGRKPPTPMGPLMHRAVELGADPKSFLGGGVNADVLRFKGWLGPEAIEQTIVAAVLRSEGALFEGSLAGLGSSTVQAAAITLTTTGKGVPDLKVYGTYQARGVAIEMKAPGKKNTVSDDQQWWLEALTKRGWVTAVCDSADEAVALLVEHGHVGGDR